MQDKLQESPLNFKRAQEKCLSKRKGREGEEGGERRLLAESARRSLRNYIGGACMRNSESRRGKKAFQENGNEI